MSIQVKVVSRRDPQKGILKYYGEQVRRGERTINDIAKRISAKNTLTVADVKAALASFQEEIIEALLDGFSIRFGDIGSFHATLETMGTDTKAEWNLSQILGVKVRFSKSGVMKSAFRVGAEGLRFTIVETVAVNAEEREAEPDYLKRARERWEKEKAAKLAAEEAEMRKADADKSKAKSDTDAQEPEVDK